MDLTTLLERTNDAIDTIIQHDEHTETGEYLRRCFKGSILLYSILIISSCAISV